MLPALFQFALQMISMKKIWLPKHHLNHQRGAATVEFAFALMGLMVFFGIYMLFVQFFIAHERVIFSGFSAARTYEVKEKPQARAVAKSIDPDVRRIDFTKKHIVVTRDFPIPAGLDRFIFQGQGQFTIVHRSPFFKNSKYNDDNAFPY